MRTIRRIVLAAPACVIACALASCASEIVTTGGTSTYLGFTLGITSAPPAPRLEFRDEPRYDPVESSEVSVVDSPDPNCDLFRFQGSFYLFSNGYWYRSNRYDGPYTIVEVRHVPRPVLVVPETHWHHRPHWDPNTRADRGNDHGAQRGRHGGEH